MPYTSEVEATLNRYTSEVKDTRCSGALDPSRTLPDAATTDSSRASGVPLGHRTDLMYSRYAITNETDLRDGLAKAVADVVATKPIARIGRA